MKIPFFTLKGNLIDLFEFKPEDIDIEEVAHSLSNLCRYNGMTKKFYSVAEHCVLMTRHAREQWLDNEQVQKAALLHDASEAYVGDVTYHLKKVVLDFSYYEDQILNAIFKKYNVDFSGQIEEDVHWLDRCICVDEMKQLMNGIDPTLVLPADEFRGLGIECQAWEPSQARQEYLKECKKLGIQ